MCDPTPTQRFSEHLVQRQVAARRPRRRVRRHRLEGQARRAEPPPGRSGTGAQRRPAASRSSSRRAGQACRPDLAPRGPPPTPPRRGRCPVAPAPRPLRAPRLVARPPAPARAVPRSPRVPRRASRSRRAAPPSPAVSPLPPPQPSPPPLLLPVAPRSHISPPPPPPAFPPDQQSGCARCEPRNAAARTWRTSRAHQPPQAWPWHRQAPRPYQTRANEARPRRAKCRRPPREIPQPASLLYQWTARTRTGEGQRRLRRAYHPADLGGSRPAPPAGCRARRRAASADHIGRDPTGRAARSTSPT